MDQTGLAAEILEQLALPCRPLYPGRYLTLPHAESIVDLTLQEVERDGDSTNLQYLRGHRRRLAKTLTLIPYAPGPNAACIDIGCYGYLSYWVKRHLGYAHVTGVEMQPEDASPQSLRRITAGIESVDLPVHNFDIGRPEWPIQGQYDTVLFFETLEHVCTDPVGIMTNVGRLMSPTSTLVMSVPNAVSHKTLNEFLCGNPPWVYWFFHPDLKHEPRHCFEYTPFILLFLLRSAGFMEAGTQSMVAFSEPHDIKDLYDLARDLSIDERWFGEVLLTQARKMSNEPPIRYPACIYDAAAYYEFIHPIINPIRWKALNLYKTRHEQALAEAKSANDRVEEALNLYKTRHEQALAEAKSANDRAEEALNLYKTRHEQALAEAKSANDRAELAEVEIAQLRAQVSDSFLGFETALLFRARAEHLGTKLTEMEATHAQTQAKLAEVEATHAQTQAKLAELEATQTGTQAKLEEVEATHAQTQAKLAEVEATHAQTQAKLVEAEATKRQSFNESLRAVGYIALPYNKRRREKRKALLKGLPYGGNIGRPTEGAASPKATTEMFSSQKRSGLQSFLRGLRAIGYFILPYNRRRGKKRKAMITSLRERT
jgi:2-polyprenyl-3-methyl-5-hydroxy-6-metoxy-1,4-benzoquinol methylase